MTDVKSCSKQISWLTSKIYELRACQLLTSVINFFLIWNTKVFPSNPIWRNRWVYTAGHNWKAMSEINREEQTLMEHNTEVCVLCVALLLFLLTFLLLLYMYSLSYPVCSLYSFHDMITTCYGTGTYNFLQGNNFQGGNCQYRSISIDWYWGIGLPWQWLLPSLQLHWSFLLSLVGVY